MANTSIDPVILTHEVLKRIDSGWFDSSDFDYFMDFFGAKPGEQKVDLSQRLLALFKSVPTNILEQENRERILDVAQEYIDKAIEEEAELEENFDEIEEESEEDED